jgi:serine O-acetyltransferase
MDQNSFKYLRYLIYTDFFRITEKPTVKNFISSLLHVPGFKYCFWMRVCRYLKYKNIIKLIFYPIAKGMYIHYTYKYGISIPFTISISEGFYIGHFGGIFVNPKVTIGKNCNISQDVTIGVKNRGENVGVPTICNDVYIGPGAKIFGKIMIGNNVAIGANSVITKDIPDNSVVVGIPGRIISSRGSEGYVEKTNYKSFTEF